MDHQAYPWITVCFLVPPAGTNLYLSDLLQRMIHVEAVVASHTCRRGGALQAEANLLVRFR